MCPATRKAAGHWKEIDVSIWQAWRSFSVYHRHQQMQVYSRWWLNQDSDSRTDLEGISCADQARNADQSGSDRTGSGVLTGGLIMFRIWTSDRGHQMCPVKTSDSGGTVEGTTGKSGYISVIWALTWCAVASVCSAVHSFWWHLIWWHWCWSGRLKTAAVFPAFVVDQVAGIRTPAEGVASIFAVIMLWCMNWTSSEGVQRVHFFLE